MGKDGCATKLHMRIGAQKDYLLHAAFMNQMGFAI